MRPTIVPDVEPPAPPVQGVVDPEQDDGMLGPSVAMPTVGEQEDNEEPSVGNTPASSRRSQSQGESLAAMTSPSLLARREQLIA